MERWQEKAKFVLKALEEDDRVLFRDDDSEHTQHKEHDAFVREWGFSYNDIWNLDKAMAMFLLPRMAYFRANCMGIPSKLSGGGSTAVRIIPEDEDEDDEAMREWYRILDTICDGCHLYLEKEPNDFTEEEAALWQQTKQYLFDYWEAFWN